MGRGSVILLQADNLGAREVLFKSQDVGDFRAPPRIDGLIVITHAANILALLSE